MRPKAWHRGATPALNSPDRLCSKSGDAFADTLQSQQNNASHTTLNSSGHSYNPHHSGTAQARIVATTPDNGNMMRLDLNAVTLARKSVAYRCLFYAHPDVYPGTD